MTIHNLIGPAIAAGHPRTRTAARAVLTLVGWSVVVGLLVSCSSNGGSQHAPDYTLVAPDGTRVAHVRTPGTRDQETIFSALPWPAGNLFRTSAGEPGPAYWQNSANYHIDVDFDEPSRTVRATCEVNYFNRSPHTLNELWLHLDQNLYREGSTGSRLARPGDRFRSKNEITGGLTIQSVTDGQGRSLALEERGTLARLKLGMPLLPQQSSTSFTITYSFRVPEFGSDRMGIRECQDGPVYQIAQWFPAVAKYDDVHGWNKLPYLGEGEFYSDFGTYAVQITVPGDHIVAATGELTNAQEVLLEDELSRLSAARSSDEPIVIRSIEEIGNREGLKGQRRTWRFSASACRTFAWATSRAFQWDACTLSEQDAAGGSPAGRSAPLAGVDLQTGTPRTNAGVLCQSFYPRESRSLWGPEHASGGSTRMVRESIKHYSRMWHEYPYPSASNVSGIVGGMEYPQIVFCNEDEDEYDLWYVTTHEIGHTWFPMMVNTDERRHAWMDEGLCSFINIYANFDRYPDRFPKLDIAEFADEYPDPFPQPVDTMPDRLLPRMLGKSQYAKPAVALAFLREGILGPDRFDEAFREYIRRWAFKSPRPWDFFRTMEDVTGEDLSWFWRGWFYETGVLDQAVTTVSQPGGQSGEMGGRNARVTFRNLGGQVAPVDYEVTYDDGTSERRVLPVEAWFHSDEWQTMWDTKGRRIKTLEIDPDGVFPDVNRRNNVWG